MIKVYIASKYSDGDKQQNVYLHLEAAHRLIDLGFSVFAPLLSHYIDLYFPKSYDVWMNHDLEWLPVCDCLLRLDGESPGADIEVKEAEKLGIPVFYDIKSLEEWAIWK